MNMNGCTHDNQNESSSYKVPATVTERRSCLFGRGGGLLFFVVLGGGGFFCVFFLGGVQI